MNQDLISDLDFKDLISELLKQTQRPEWHLQAFIEHCVIMLSLSQKNL